MNQIAAERGLSLAAEALAVEKMQEAREQVQAPHDEQQEVRSLGGVLQNASQQQSWEQQELQSRQAQQAEKALPELKPRPAPEPLPSGHFPSPSPSADGDADGPFPVFEPAQQQQQKQVHLLHLTSPTAATIPTVPILWSLAHLAGRRS